MLGRLLYEIPSRLQPATQENRAAPTGLIISNERAPSVPLRSTLGYPDSAPTALGFRQLARQTESHSVRRGAPLSSAACAERVERLPDSMRPSPPSQRTSVAAVRIKIAACFRHRFVSGHGLSRAVEVHKG